MIGEALRLMRVYHDMKAVELAQQLNISSSYLSEIEHQKKQPTIDLIKKYAVIFNIKPSAILFFSEEVEGFVDQQASSDKNTLKSRIKIALRPKILKLLSDIENASH